MCDECGFSARSSGEMYILTDVNVPVAAFCDGECLFSHVKRALYELQEISNFLALLCALRLVVTRLGRCSSPMPHAIPLIVP